MQVRHAVAAVSAVLTMSAAGLGVLKLHEGLGQPGQQVQKAYADPYWGWRVATICYGHTRGVKQGDTATLEQCDHWLQEDVSKACKIVSDSLVGYEVNLTPGEVDAYCSFAYNLGKFKGTASVHGRLIQGDHWGACEGLLKYTYSNGQYSRGLANRRQEEYKLCTRDLS